MALVKCKECGHDVSTNAKACPNCGARPPSKSGIGWALFVGIGAVVALLLFVLAPSGEKRPEGKTSTVQPVRKKDVGREAPVVRGRVEGDYYVAVSTLNVRSAPRTGEVVNRLHLRQKVTVSAIDNGWGRITPANATPRWVSMEYLTRTRPQLPESKPVPQKLRDPRIAKDAIPKVGENGLTQTDVDILWKGANWALRTGKCSRIEYADKSVSRTNTYYVNCGGRNVFFTPAQIAK